VPPATTGDDGRFTLTGVGRDRLLDITIGGPTIEHRSAEVMTRQGPTRTLPGTGLVLPGNEPTNIGYGATLVHVAAPTKPILGVVRDEDTGEPLAGVEVYSLHKPDVAGHGRELDGADFTALALDPERPRRLFFYHKEHDLGGSLVVRGDEAAAVTARLEPCGTVSGRLLGADFPRLPLLR
jgi:hypothetical protein